MQARIAVRVSASPVGFRAVLVYVYTVCVQVSQGWFNVLQVPPLNNTMCDCEHPCICLSWLQVIVWLLMHAPNADCNCVCSLEVCRLIPRGWPVCLRMCAHVNIHTCVCVCVLGGKWISGLKLQSHYKPRLTQTSAVASQWVISKVQCELPLR